MATQRTIGIEAQLFNILSSLHIMECVVLCCVVSSMGKFDEVYLFEIVAEQKKIKNCQEARCKEKGQIGI